MAVLVKKPDSIEYDIIIKYWINSSDKNRTTLIQGEVEKALDEYKQWQRSVMGRDINPDEIIQRLKNAGAKRLEISSPETVPTVFPAGISNKTSVWKITLFPVEI